jgi:hypothetical protein
MDNYIKASIKGELHKNLYFNKNVSISFDTLEFHKDCEYKVLVQIEPQSILNIVNKIISKQNDFDLILSWHPKILSECKNSHLFPFGSCWIDYCDRIIHKKNKTLSIISSSKKQTEGHKLRHFIINNSNISMEVFGGGYNPIKNKIISFKDYMFSIIIENEKTNNWFTEKVIDCLVTGTIPIYWGCPNIGDYFDIRGFIIFKDYEDFKRKTHLINETTYLNMLPYIEKNYDLAKNYTDFWGRVVIEINKNL